MENFIFCAVYGPIGIHFQQRNLIFENVELWCNF